MSAEYKTGTVRTVTTTVVDMNGLEGLFSLPFTVEPVGGEVHVFERGGIRRYWWVNYPDYMVEMEVLEEYGFKELPNCFEYFTGEDFEDFMANRGHCHAVGMNRGRFLTVEETRKFGAMGRVDRLFLVDADYVHSKGIDYHTEQLQHDYDAWAAGDVFEVVCVAVDTETGAYDCISGGFYYGWESLDGVAEDAADLCEQVAGEVEWKKNKAGEVA